MSYTIETPKKLRKDDIEAAAGLTALGFGRRADTYNLQDTTEHLSTADHVQLVHDDNEHLVGFAAYRRLLWQPSR